MTASVARAETEQRRDSMTKKQDVTEAWKEHDGPTRRNEQLRVTMESVGEIRVQALLCRQN